MQINYLGHSSFKIKTKSASLVTDPFSNSVGYFFPKTEADIVTISHHHDDHNFVDGIKNSDRFVIDGPGEYEIKEIMITGIKTFHDNEKGEKRGTNTVYLIESEDLVICHLGDLGHELSDKQLKELENTNILCIPVGGEFTIDPKVANKIIKQIEPTIVLPMHYKQEGMAPMFDNLFTIEAFVEEIGLEAKKDSKLILTESTMPEEMEVWVLDRK